MAKSLLEQYEYLKAMKLGEKQTFPNRTPNNLPPSHRPAYKHLSQACYLLNKELGAAHFTLRSPTASSAEITRVYDGVNSIDVAPINRVRKNYKKRGAVGYERLEQAISKPVDVLKHTDEKLAAAQRTAAPSTELDIKKYIDEAVQRMAAPQGRDIWLLRFDDAPSALVFGDLHAAEQTATALGLNEAHIQCVREVSA